MAPVRLPDASLVGGLTVAIFFDGGGGKRRRRGCSVSARVCVGGGRDEGGGWGDVLAHDGFLEAFAVLLGAPVDAAAFLGDPHGVKVAAIGPASFLGVARFLRLSRALFKRGEAGADTGEGGGQYLLAVVRSARLLFDGGQSLFGVVQALGVGEGNKSIELERGRVGVRVCSVPVAPIAGGRGGRGRDGSGRGGHSYAGLTVWRGPGWWELLIGRGVVYIAHF